MPLGIPVLHDTITGRPVEATIVLASDDTDISLLRAQIRRERKAKSSRYGCGLCRDPVYVSNSGGTSHFAHYIDSGPQCAWRSELPSSLDAISAGRFQGKQEGKLHQRLLRTLEALCQRSKGFSDVGTPNATLFGLGDTGHRFPDLAAVFDGKRIVFELQISKTYLPVISDREAFYRQNGIYLVWLFHNFEQWHERQTERDIVALRSRQAFELNDEAIRATLDSGSLTLKAHWQVPEWTGAEVSWRWKTRLIKFEELTFDEYLVEALVANPWHDEAILLRDRHSALITKFEKFWIGRWEWSAAQHKIIHQQAMSGQSIDQYRMPENVERRAFETVITAAGGVPAVAGRVKELKFHQLLDRLMFLRDGTNYFGKQSIAGAIDTILENWPHFTDAIVAVASSYDYAEILKRPNAIRKIQQNLIGNEHGGPAAQCHDFDRLVAMLFPKAAAWLRASSLSMLKK
jgi:hypothetical protein